MSGTGCECRCLRWGSLAGTPLVVRRAVAGGTAGVDEGFAAPRTPTGRVWSISWWQMESALVFSLWPFLGI